jgi:ubiquinone/menaquinone biosynthesis C-methylase UbiE
MISSPEKRVQEDSVPSSIWRASGVTEHLGGITATRQLVAQCQVIPDQYILDIGCGTGFTACYLARTQQAHLVAIDIDQGTLLRARKRFLRDKVARRVWLVRADAHHLPFASRVFDVVIIESVLIFCHAQQVAAEACAVLKAGALLGVNELAFTGSPTDDLARLLQEKLRIRAFTDSTWENFFTTVGKSRRFASIHRINLFEQLASHLRVNGVGGYFTGVVRSFSEKNILRAFFNRQMLHALLRFSSQVRYYLFVGCKSP